MNYLIDDTVSQSTLESVHTQYSYRLVNWQKAITKNLEVGNNVIQMLVGKTSYPQVGQAYCICECQASIK